MSKSKNNGVDPQTLIEQYGADTARLFVMFASPPEQTAEWNDAGVEGAHRFLRRVWAFGAKHADALRAAGDLTTALAANLSAPAKALRREVHNVLRQISYDYERMQYNTVVSGAMKLLNGLERFAHHGDAHTLGLQEDAEQAAIGWANPAANWAAVREGFSVLLRALYPACPHVTHELWSTLGFASAHGDLLDAPWPAVDESALQQDEIELVLQIAGKTRGTITVATGADQLTIESAALASPEFAKFAQDKAVRKVVVVPGRLVNVVV